MHTPSSPGIRPPPAVHAQQQPPAHSGSPASHRPGDQVAHYKGATLRTAYASGRPSGPAKGLLARLKPRPQPAGSGVERTGSEGAGAAADGLEPRAGDNATDGHGPREGRDHEGGGPSDGEGNGAPSDAKYGGPTAAARARWGARTRPALPAARRSSAERLRADWAVVAFDSGGAPAVHRALAGRLLQAARAPGIAGWRQPWLAPIGAAHAAAGASRAAGSAAGLAGVRDLLVTLPPTIPGHRLLPNAMRATFFCLLPLVLLDLQRPRTATQRQDLLVRLAALARPTVAPRPF